MRHGQLGWRAAVIGVLYLCLLCGTGKGARAEGLLRDRGARRGRGMGEVGEWGRPSHRRSSASPAPLPADAVVSSHKCYRMTSWGDVCVHHNVCFDGLVWNVLDPRSSNTDVHSTKWKVTRGDLLEGYLMPSKPAPRVALELFPFNSGTKGRLITPEAVLSSPSVTVTWSNVTLWQVALDVALSNIWFFASRVLPLYTARHMNATGMFDKPLPPLGEEDILFSQLVNGRRRHRKEWHQNVLAVATGGRTKMEYAREPWAAQWSPTNQLCFRNAVFTGAFAYAVPDVETGFAFREEVFQHMGVPLPLKPAPRILFFLRKPGYSRELINTQQLLDVAEAYGLEYTVVTKVASFKEQLEMFASHGVVVSPHGAGLVNEMFLVPHSAVVELFPYHMDHTLYPTLASHMGVGNYPVHAINGSNIWARSPAYFRNFCEEVPSLEVSWESGPAGGCRESVMNKGFAIDPKDFEVALVNAVEHAGFRIRYRNLRGPGVN